MNDDLRDPITYLKVVRDQLARIEKTLNTIKGIGWVLIGGMIAMGLMR